MNFILELPRTNGELTLFFGLLIVSLNVAEV